MNDEQRRILWHCVATRRGRVDAMIQNFKKIKGAGKYQKLYERERAVLTELKTGIEQNRIT